MTHGYWCLYICTALKVSTRGSDIPSKPIEYNTYLPIPTSSPALAVSSLLGI